MNLQLNKKNQAGISLFKAADQAYLGIVLAVFALISISYTDSTVANEFVDDINGAGLVTDADPAVAT